MSQPDKMPYSDSFNKNRRLIQIALSCAAAGILLILFSLSIGAVATVTISAAFLVILSICVAAELFHRQSSAFSSRYRNLDEYITKLQSLPEELPKNLYDAFISVVDQSSVVEAKYQKLIAIIEMLQKNEPFQTILDNIYVSFAEYLPYTHIGIALIDRDSHTIRASFAATSEKHAELRKKLLGYEINLNHTSLEQVLNSGKPRLINDLEAYQQGHRPSDYNRILLHAGIRSSISYPLIKNGQPIGIIFFSSDRPNAYTKEHVDFLNTLANSLMFSLERDIIADEMVVSTTLALAVLTDERSPETGDHLTRMKRYSRLIAELLSKDERYSGRVDLKYVSSIERFSPLHDIGKVAIPDAILNKPGRLTSEEFEIMKTHTIYGAMVLRQANENLKSYGRSIFETGIEIVESHHERWDGSGYPNGYAGSRIPLSARIVAVADVFDALTSERVYKKAMSPDEALEIIHGESGTHFDPEIVEIFEKNFELFRKMFHGFTS